MYISPDYEKVSMNTADAFAAYSGCQEKEFLTWINTYPCEGKSDYHQVTSTMTAAGYDYQCFTGNMG